MLEDGLNDTTVTNKDYQDEASKYIYESNPMTWKEYDDDDKEKRLKQDCSYFSQTPSEETKA